MHSNQPQPVRAEAHGRPGNRQDAANAAASTPTQRAPGRLWHWRQRTREAMPQWLRRLTASLSTPGLLLATLFFAASLSPSLLPRTWVMQGMLSGLSLAAGYLVGVLASWVWGYLEMPFPRARIQRAITLAATVLCVATALVFLREASDWQNSIRELMQMEPVDSARPFRVGLIALLVFAVGLTLGRLFLFTKQIVSHRLHRRLVPRRVANVIGVAVAVALFWSVIDGVLFSHALRAADTSFQQFDALMEADVEQPLQRMRTGSPASLVNWNDLGRTGRAYVSTGPDGQSIAGFLGEPAPDPIRVYVGLNSADTPEERARLALRELQRTGAFERSALILVTPTGTGWIDPKAMGPVEYLLRGDVASVAVQYSYLPSWLSLMAESEYGAETARAVFATVYGYWRSLPRDSRPELYLHGLSLGALNSGRAADMYDVIADPFAGALWSGPPFRDETWRTMTEQRQPGSPAWLPRFRDGSVVRFTHQQNTLRIPGAEWGPMRIVYLQYASDPITFFEPQSAWRPPEWMAEPRGPDVSPRLRWFPVVTMLQLAVDMAAADQAPVGYGHVYAAEHYIDAWLEVIDPPGWSAADVQRLKERFAP